ncbi:hypothetical protein [Anaerocolumna chitinilytica]|uniref:Uncharacterized protein n=1 Tax=Anaerocolumna chitinilytica TaxID=1727145 RepID=A0A7M3SAK6_9FIRM|nr:hypothetical protein [Anaerocolumna chitinilytica]BCK01624.1 hypothetical protein bsdcttw_46640 [Anaerocolumna chitinilytica]
MLFSKETQEFMTKVFTEAKELKRGGSKETECICGGTLHIGKSGYNGHIHAACDKCKRSIMQ